MATNITTAAFLQRQREGIREEWKQWGHFWAGVKSPAGFSGRLFGRGEWKGLSSLRQQNAIVVGPETSSPELWVRPDYSDYEGAFSTFGREYYGYDYLAAPEKQSFDVDHLFSHTRAGPVQLGLALVRLALVPRAINRSWGSYVEKILVTTDAQHRGKTHHRSTAFLLAKFLGEPAPAKTTYQSDIRQLADQIVESGFEPASNRDLLVFEMTYLYEQEVLGIEPKKKSWP